MHALTVRLSDTTLVSLRKLTSAQHQSAAKVVASLIDMVAQYDERMCRLVDLRAVRTALPVQYALHDYLASIENQISAQKTPDLISIADTKAAGLTQEDWDGVEDDSDLGDMELED